MHEYAAIKKAKVMHEYAATLPDELSLEVGQIVEILKQVCYAFYVISTYLQWILHIISLYYLLA